MPKVLESGYAKGFRERIAYAREVIRNRSNIASKTHYAFPVEGVTSVQVTEIFSSQSNKKPEYTTISTRNMRNNEEFLTEQEQREKEVFDEQLRAALTINDFVNAKEVIKERAKVLQEALTAIFNGKPERNDKKKRVKFGGLREMRILLRALGNKPMRELRKLYRKGFSVDSLVPELDTLVPIDHAVRLYDSPSSAVKHTRVMEGAPHDGIALQPGVWAEQIYALNETKAA